MLYVVDTADLAEIAHINEFYPLDGVTTNPTLVSREKTDFWKLLTGIRSVIGPEKILCAQTLQTEAEAIVEEGKVLQERIGGNFYIKIPIGEAGLKATMELKKQGIRVLMTAIFTPGQALVAAKAGADFVAPYVNRIDMISGNGTRVVAEIVKEFSAYGLPCKVMAASFKNVQQVQECSQAGCHCATVAPDVFRALIAHPLTDAAIAGFEKDWKSVYGEKNILDL